jgi:hypothetical protein
MPTPHGTPPSLPQREPDPWTRPEPMRFSDDDGLEFAPLPRLELLESEEQRELRLLERENQRLLMELKRRRLEQP